MNDEIVNLEVEFRHETENAVLVEYDGDEYWIPKSQISDMDEDSYSKGDMFFIEIPEWLAEEKGMI